jgi:hypothetical protein
MTATIDFRWLQIGAGLQLSKLPLRLLSLPCAAIDAALIGRCITGSIDPMIALGAHLGVVMLAGGLCATLRKQADPQFLIVLAVLLLCGPMGSFMILVSGLDAADQIVPAEILQDRTNDMAAPQPSVSVSEAVFDDIRQGRRPQRMAGALGNLELTFLHGDLAQQQRALSAISRFYQPEMLPALRLALMSRRPALRVQAAAVYAKLRGKFGDRAKALMQMMADDQDLSAQDHDLLTAECRAVAASGFISAALAAQLLGLTETRGTGSPQGGRNGSIAAPRRTPRRHLSHGLESAPPQLKRYTCGGIA